MIDLVSEILRFIEISKTMMMGNVTLAIATQVRYTICCADSQGMTGAQTEV